MKVAKHKFGKEKQTENVLNIVATNNNRTVGSSTGTDIADNIVIRTININIAIRNN